MMTWILTFTDKVQGTGRQTTTHSPTMLETQLLHFVFRIPILKYLCFHCHREIILMVSVT